MKRIGIIGFLHESNSFSPLPTKFSHFELMGITTGDALVQRWQNSNHELGGFFEGAKKFQFEPVPLFATYAVPSGPIIASAFNRLSGDIIAQLKKALPLDGLLLALHGATVSENFPDADGELASRIRGAVGEATPIVMTLDLHANVSPRMIANTNATVCYASNPHVDQKERGLEAAEIIARTLSGEIKPVQALEKPPLIINISRQYTARPPAAGLYQDRKEVTRWPGIVSSSVTMGFYYSDVAEMGASFIAVANGAPELARKAARWIAGRAWARREEFLGDLVSASDAVRQAAAALKGPVILMDVGDNVGGGSPADSTLIFHEIIKQGAPNALVILYDPEAVAACISTGVRKEIELAVGGKTDKLHGHPVDIEGKIRLISDGLFVEPAVRHGGWGRYDQGVSAVVETNDGHTVILTSERTPPFSLQQLFSIGINPENKKIIVVKGVIAPRAAYEPIASLLLTVDTGGCTTANPSMLEYHHRPRPIYPLEMDATYPA